MFNLKPFEAVYFGEGYLVSLPHGEFFIDDQKVFGPKQLQINKDSNVVKYEKFPGKTLRYVDEELSYTKENVEGRIEEIHDQYYSEEFEEYEYPDLDTEYAVKKELQNLRSLSRVKSAPQEKYTPIEVTIIGSLEDTGSDFIITSVSLGKKSFNGRGVYKLNASGVADHELRSYCAQNEIEVDVPTHSNIKYAKIGGEYLFTNMKESDNNVELYFDDLSEAKDREQKIRVQVRKRIGAKMSKVSDIDVGGVIKSIENLENRASELDVKSRSKTTKSEISRGLSKIKSMLLDAI